MTYDSPGCARGETKTAPALADVVAERRRQDQQWGGPDHDDDHSPADWMSYIHYQLQKLQKEGPGDIIKFRERMVKVAALAVAAIEYSDRDLAAAGKLQPQEPEIVRAYRALAGHAREGGEKP